MIRRSKEADIEKLLDIWLKANIQSHNFISNDYWEKMLPTVRKYYLPNTDTFVFEDNILNISTTDKKQIELINDTFKSLILDNLTNDEKNNKVMMEIFK